jgi:ABC-type dipeptide/oligopeptide/nickel transport system permease subunit
MKKDAWTTALRKLYADRLTMIALVVILVYFFLAFLTSTHLIFPNIVDFHNEDALRSPSLQHWFGTDIFGRDVLGKAVYGARTALFIGLVASLIAVPIGTFFGAIAGYCGGWVDQLIVWFYTTVDAVPSILLIIAFSYVLGPGLVNTYIAIGSTSWASLCRLVRSEFMRQRERDYVVAAGALGAGHTRRILTHILPNTLHLILIQFSLTFVYAIKSEVILSYLGLGAEAGQFSWGIMIDDSKQGLLQGVWWEMACATIAMFLIVLAFNIFNDGLVSALNPRAQKH